MERFAPRTRLLDYGFVAFYKKNKNIPEKYKIKDRTELIKISKIIFKTIAKNLINKEGGVVLNNFGYLCHWKSPDKKIFKIPVKGGYKLIANYHTNGYFYNTSLFTNILGKNPFKGWSLDKSFHRDIKKGRYLKLRSGIKYKFYYSLVRRLYTTIYHNRLDRKQI